MSVRWVPGRVSMCTLFLAIALEFVACGLVSQGDAIPRVTIHLPAPIHGTTR